MERILIFVVIVLLPWPIAVFAPSAWIIWNVGQGEWVTHVSDSVCRHFDMGGEKFPKERLRRLCGNKRNEVFLSHWDMDHVGFVQRAHAILPNFCLAVPPIGQASEHKKELLRDLAACPPAKVTVWNPEILSSKKRTSNELCHIFEFDRALVPGDAPAAEERQFVIKTGAHPLVRLLILGHHGSRTSTSAELLDGLPNLKMAIASSRHGKYGHPHIETIKKLQDRRIPMLTTEEWGDIEIAE